MPRIKKNKVEWVVPTNKADMVIIQNAIVEASNSKLRIEAENDHIKHVFEQINEQYGMTRRKFNSWVKTYHKQTYNATVQDMQEFTSEYASVMNKVDNNITEV